MEMEMDVVFYICKDPGHLANRCLERHDNKNMSSDHTMNAGNKSPRPLEECKYCRPADFRFSSFTCTG